MVKPAVLPGARTSGNRLRCPPAHPIAKPQALAWTSLALPLHARGRGGRFRDGCRQRAHRWDCASSQPGHRRHGLQGPRRSRPRMRVFHPGCRHVPIQPSHVASWKRMACGPDADSRPASAWRGLALVGFFGRPRRPRADAWPTARAAPGRRLTPVRNAAPRASMRPVGKSVVHRRQGTVIGAGFTPPRRQVTSRFHA